MKRINILGGIMTDTKIYRDIAERTGGDVYIGVVGPVRSGKSTFIKKFMENAVLPAIASESDRARARDELPQSAGGKTVMTAEPKFIPDDGVRITTADNAEMKVKLIDCVGYLIPEALGTEEDGSERMVHTPWHSEPVPFTVAAEYGTKKVIAEHSTIGMLVTSDGTVGDFPRESYVAAEEKVVGELTNLGKPFAVILNSSAPEREASVELAMHLEKKYNAPVALVNCLDLNGDDIRSILAMVLEEFPAKEADILLPPWTAVLPEDHKLREGLRGSVIEASEQINRLRDVREGFKNTLEEGIAKAVGQCGNYKNGVSIKELGTDAGEGRVTLGVELPEELYFDIISEITGISMKNQTELLDAINTLSAAKREFDKYKDAINDVNEHGYGIVMPDSESMNLEKPEIVKQAGGYGVKLRANAPSVHMIRTNIEAEINPMIGTEQQSEEMVSFLTKGMEEDPESVWNSNMFGRSLYDLLNDGLGTKLRNLPEDARLKFGETLSKVINEGSQGLICIIL